MHLNGLPLQLPDYIVDATLGSWRWRVMPSVREQEHVDGKSTPLLLRHLLRGLERVLQRSRYVGSRIRGSAGPKGR
ncbi:hypothetical protein TBR22_A06010 [Luteitalea sp. TBR-22]|nr:hypothetical protein TBR22_A06010 [Luteitalea sp. TBR-22]